MAGVARGTAREALKKLEADGLVDTLPAVGIQNPSIPEHCRRPLREPSTGEEDDGER